MKNGISGSICAALYVYTCVINVLRLAVYVEPFRLFMCLCQCYQGVPCMTLTQGTKGSLGSTFRVCVYLYNIYIYYILIDLETPYTVGEFVSC